MDEREKLKNLLQPPLMTDEEVRAELEADGVDVEDSMHRVWQMIHPKIEEAKRSRLGKVSLTVILVDTWPTYCAAMEASEHLPYKRRHVTVDLTPEQVSVILPRKVGSGQNGNVYEVIAECWLETEEEKE